MKLKHLTMRLYVIYVLNTHKISFKLDDIYCGGVKYGPVT